MQFKEYIKSVILEIEEGVKLAQHNVNDAIINPTMDQRIKGGGKGSINDYHSCINVEIEACIVSSVDKKGGVNLQIISANYSGKAEEVSKVKFTLPILLTPHDLPEDS